MREIKLPEIGLVLLVGATSSGKSSFARQHFKPTEVISSDACRALVSDDENNQEATKEAFEILNHLAAVRLRLGRFTVIDATNLRKEDRAKLIQLGRDNYALVSALTFPVPMKELIRRHEGRADRTFSIRVIERQAEDFRRSARGLKGEGFAYAYDIQPDEEVAIVRQRLWNNRTNEKGPFDLIGDVHGCFAELQDLLKQLGYQIQEQEDGHFATHHPERRKAVFVGDLVDRGPDTPRVLRLVMDMVAQGTALAVKGNHDEKLQKYLQGRTVNVAHGLECSIEQLAAYPDGFKKEVIAFLDSMISHYMLDEGRLVVAHAGIREEMQGRAAAAVRQFCLYGETTGEIDEFGLPLRYPWAKDYRGKALVVYGHTPIPRPDWVNNTVNIDTGCVFGGSLTALRYPERELVSVQAREEYAVPKRPLVIPEPEPSQAEDDGLLDIGVIADRYTIQTRLGNRVSIKEGNAAAALEVMSRFAVHPRWLIYLPPTMSPPETSKLPDFLEHPLEAFAYFRKQGVKEVVCEEKHMGSRAVVIVCRTPEVAVTRFGLPNPAPGIVYTRTGRRFFPDIELEKQFLRILNQALTDADFWERFNTDWFCLDGELMPWSAKAIDLIHGQYAAVYAAASNGLKAAETLLELAKSRLPEVKSLLVQTRERKAAIDAYGKAYRPYVREVKGLEGLQFAPFHLLAAEGKVFDDQTHTWHMETLKELCAARPEYLLATPYRVVSLENEAGVQQTVDWWLQLTATGGEGMVIKPMDFIAYNRDMPIQPAVKCRGPEYLRIIYGPEYMLGGNLEVLKERSVKTKRQLAGQEFALSLEALHRFVEHGGYARMHECVFGILALESEPVDPRL